MDLWSTAELIGAREEIDVPNTFIKNTFFNTGVIAFDTEEIVFDKVNSSRLIAAYVSPEVAGRPQAIRGAQATSFRPAYVKPTTAISPSATIKRRPGEVLTGSMTRQQRFDRITVQTLQDHEWSIARREEVMCLEILRTGRVIVESPEFPRMSVDFARPSGHTLALTGGARWGETGVSPYDDIKAMAQTVHDGSGAHPQDVVFDPKAAELFLRDPQIDNKLNNRRQDGGSAQFFGAVNGVGIEAVLIAEFGQFRFWQYQAIYGVPGGTVKVMPDYTVIMGSAGIEGWMTYGAIEDLESMVAEPRFDKMYDEKNPSRAFLQSQSAPLPVPVRVESSACITVR